MRGSPRHKAQIRCNSDRRRPYNLSGDSKYLAELAGFAEPATRLKWSPSCNANGRQRSPRATFKSPITVGCTELADDRLPFRLLQCWLVTNGGGALILVSAERFKDFPTKLVYVLGTGESVEAPMVSPTRHSCESRNPLPQNFGGRPGPPLLR